MFVLLRSIQPVHHHHGHEGLGVIQPVIITNIHRYSCKTPVGLVIF